MPAAGYRVRVPRLAMPGSEGLCRPGEHPFNLNSERPEHALAIPPLAQFVHVLGASKHRVLSGLKF